MENGDLVIKYKEERSIDSELDQKIMNFLKTLGYKWNGSGWDVQTNIRDISFTKKN